MHGDEGSRHVSASAVAVSGEANERFRFIDPMFYVDAEDAFAWLHEHAPVFRYDPRPHYPREMWVITKWEDARHVYRNADLFSSSQGTTLELGVGAASINPSPVAPDDRLAIAGRKPTLLDDPEHTRHRRLVRDLFRPSRLRALEPKIRSVVGECFDGVDNEVIDFGQAVGRPVPMRLIVDLLGLDPSMADDFARWSDAMMSSYEPGNESGLDAVNEMFDFLEEQIRDRESNPGQDDLIADLVAAEHDGDRFTHYEILMWCWALLVAGQETTATLLISGLRALLETEGELDKLRADPETLDTAVSEMLRWVTPNRSQTRTATQETVVRGQEIAAGDLILVSNLAANRDPEIYPDPYRFDVTRPNDHESLSFGFGPHYCLGALLARLETRIVFEQLVERFSSIELVSHEPAFGVTSSPPGVLKVRLGN